MELVTGPRLEPRRYGYPSSSAPELLLQYQVFFFLFFKDFIYLYLERGREEERERNINVWFPLVHPLLGTWPATQACALTGNPTGDPVVCRLVLNPLSHTCQGYQLFFLISLCQWQIFQTCERGCQCTQNLWHCKCLVFSFCFSLLPQEFINCYNIKISFSCDDSVSGSATKYSAELDLLFQDFVY